MKRKQPPTDSDSHSQQTSSKTNAKSLSIDSAEKTQSSKLDSESNMNLVKELRATKEHCFYCFDTLVNHFQGKPPHKPLFENADCPLFVSWHKRDTKDLSEYHLRGCIGTFSPTKIHEGLKQYAISSAMRDSRFSAVKKQELPNLQCSVSLLTNFEEVDSIYDWEPGVHGVWIEFEDLTGRKRHATYLPEIALDQGWTQEQTLKSLIRKAGCKEASFSSLADRIRLTRYQSSKCSATYDEYVQTLS